MRGVSRRDSERMRRAAVCEARLERRLKRPFIGRSDARRENGRVTLLMFRTLILSWLAAGPLLALTGAPALADSDQDRARAAVQAGKVLPLRTLLERLERTHPGQVLEVEIEQDNGRWIYEIKLLQPGGRLLRLELDAATAEVLRHKERSRRSDPRP